MTSISKVACVHVSRPSPVNIGDAIAIFSKREILPEFIGGHNKSGKIASFKRIRKSLEDSPVLPDVYLLGGVVDGLGSNQHKLCVQLGTDVVLIESTLPGDSLAGLMDEMLSISKGVILAYAFEMDQSRGVYWYCNGVVFAKGWTRDPEGEQRIGNWRWHTINQELGTKLREVFSINVFRAQRILVGNEFLESWIESEYPGTLRRLERSELLVFEPDLSRIPEISERLTSMTIVAAGYVPPRASPA